MTPVTTMPTSGRPRPRSRLRLVADTAGDQSAPAANGRPTADGTPAASGRPTAGGTPTANGAPTAGPASQGDVLVAGGDPSSRKRMVEEMQGLLPAGASFVEAGETWQVVVKAPHSRMVILTGDLKDISARGLMRVLGRRHPLLPVIALGGQPGIAQAGGLGAASL